jgi:hypothetical protein
MSNLRNIFDLAESLTPLSLGLGWGGVGGPGGGGSKGDGSAPGGTLARK